MSIETVFKDPSALISKVRYETERSRYALAILGISPVVLALSLLIGVTDGAALLVILAATLLLWLSLWFTGKVVKELLLMNLVEVNENNFSEIHEIIEHAKYTLQYRKKIRAYIWPGSQVGLHTLHYLDRKIFIIESALLEDEPSEEEISFTIMFHVARIKTKSEYFSLVTKVISEIEKIWVLNMLLCPFERATVYTADRIAMIYAGEPDYAKNALAREMVGTKLKGFVNVEAVAEQGLRCKFFFAWIARSFSPFPGYPQRFIALNDFSKSRSRIMLERHKP